MMPPRFVWSYEHGLWLLAEPADDGWERDLHGNRFRSYRQPARFRIVGSVWNPVDEPPKEKAP